MSQAVRSRPPRTAVLIGLLALLLAPEVCRAEEIGDTGASGQHSGARFASIGDAKAYGNELLTLAAKPVIPWNEGPGGRGDESFAALLHEPQLAHGEELKVAVHLSKQSDVQVEIYRFNGNGIGVLLAQDSFRAGPQTLPVERQIKGIIYTSYR